MQISEHYAGFPDKTFVVIMNHERARIFFAHHRDFDERETLSAQEPVSLDEASLKDFFSLVHARMQDALNNEGFDSLLVCVPEIHRPLFQDVTPPELSKKILRIVPKNLSAMQEGPIIRILFEG